MKLPKNFFHFSLLPGNGEKLPGGRMRGCALIKIVLGLFLCSCFGIASAKLTSHLDKDRVELGQTFSLTLKIEGAQINAMPDFQALQKDFFIEGTQSAVNYSMINGKLSSISEWTLLLTAKRSGILMIPSLMIGNEKTAPLTIEVTVGAPAMPATSQPTAQPQAGQPVNRQKQQDVMLLTEVSGQNPYVNQQLVYTVKLYNSTRLLDANYQPPQVEDALFVPLGNGKRYQANENGRIYAVEEQQFAVFPQKTGYLKITPPSFDALIYDQRPKRISIEAKPTTLNVKAIPSEFKGKNWLPAKAVKLSEGYDKGAGTLLEGSTLVRTVSLQAIALPAQLLPALDFGNSDQFSVYPEKPIESNQFKQQDLVGRSTVKVTYLLNKAGKVTIPPLNVPWFNTITGKEELSSLPGLTIEVTASAPSQLTKPEPTVTTALTQTQQPVKPKENEAKLPTAKPQNTIAWWLALGFALAWLLTAAAWAWQRKRQRFAGQTKSQIMKELQLACATNCPEEARSALIKWGRLQWLNATLLNIFDLEHLVQDPKLKEQVNGLAQFLYQDARAEKVWQGKGLWRAILNFKPANNTKTVKENPLPPINRI